MVDPANHIAKVDVVGVRRKINVGLLADGEGNGPEPGDWVLIHVGFALSRRRPTPRCSCFRGWGRNMSRSSTS